MQDIAANTHFQQRGSILSLEDPATGQILNIPNLPFRLLGTPGRVRFPGLPMGSANCAVYEKLLGCSKNRIAGLKEEGAI